MLLPMINIWPIKQNTSTKVQGGDKTAGKKVFFVVTYTNEGLKIQLEIDRALVRR